MSGGGGEERRVGKRAEQKRRWDREAYHPCEHPDCDRLVKRTSPLCVKHRDEERRAERDRRWAQIERLWNQGLSIREIAVQVNSTPASVGRYITMMRQEGWNVPYRYAMTPEGLEAIKAAQRARVR